jgi:hypothetical protein
MWSGETSDSRLRRRSGSVFDGRTLKCQSSYSTDTPSSQLTSPDEYVDAISCIFASWSSTSELISPEMK